MDWEEKMSDRRWTVTLALVVGLGLLAAPARAQRVTAERLAQLDARMTWLKEMAKGLSAADRATLPLGLRADLDLAARWDSVRAGLDRASVSGASAPVGIDAVTSLATLVALPVGRVSDPKRDLSLSSMVNFQGTTSTAWCYPSMVTVFNDSLSYFRTFYLGTGGTTSMSYSYSATSGLTFFEPGAMNAGTDPNYADAGNGSVACTKASTTANFFVAVEASNLSLAFPYNHIALHTSSDGGKTFSTPTVAVPPLTDHTYSNPWLAADPSDTTGLTLYLVFQDRQANDSATCGTAVSSRTISFSKSTDGGGNWSPPARLDTAAANICEVVGSEAREIFPHVAVGARPPGPPGPPGPVYVAFDTFKSSTHNVTLLASADGGTSWAPPTTGFPLTVAIPGDAYFNDPQAGPTAGANPAARSVLQGAYGINLRPQVAVDRSGKVGFDRNVYVAWHAAAANFAAQSGSSSQGYPSGNYYYSDVYLARSTDAGANFLAPVRLNTNVEPIATGPFAGRGTDQYLPSIAVDKYGYVGVCFYDRRADSGNFLIDRECAKSLTAGATWTNTRKTLKSFAPLTQTDLVVSATLGDFDTTVSDYTKIVAGLKSTFTDTSLGSPDVKITPLF